MRSPSEWQHQFGPPVAPVVLVAASSPTRQLVTAIRSLGTNDGAKCVIVEGGDGCGKSRAASAFQAACQEAGLGVLVVNEGSEAASIVPQLDAAEALVVDNLDHLSDGLRQALFERRHSLAGGALLTCSRMSPLERQLLVADDNHNPIDRWEERPADVLVIAGLAWDELGVSPGLAELCGDDVAAALSRGPWTRGAHSIRRAVTLLAEALQLEGYFERSLRTIGAGDVLDAIVAVILEDRPPDPEETIRILVEGSTDAVYIEAAARLASERWQFDLLGGCRVAPPGEDRQGGADKAVRELFVLDAHGMTAIALFDDDEPGRTAARDARKFSTQKVQLLPAEFDPLRNPKGSGTIEIEDLIPLPLLERFYAEHNHLQPEETTTRGDLNRIVIAGPDKEQAAAWITEHASFEDVRKIVYVICVLRESLGLPLPETCPPLPDWLRELSQ